ncbi:hypothetical protein SDC9_61649 [bioreactor metagenome]|uniref:Uncharacterized protein n=1 Tax=bioreactor metagenome TaxID=1076179 RepID=A0A644XHM3_9ZZZZ
MPGGGGAGHIAEMIARIKANETLKNDILKRRAKYVYYKTSGVIRLRRRKTSETELEIIRAKIREETRHERIRSVYALMLTLIVMVGLYFGFQYAFHEYQKLQKYRNDEIIYPETDNPAVYRPL